MKIKKSWLTWSPVWFYSLFAVLIVPIFFAIKYAIRIARIKCEITPEEIRCKDSDGSVVFLRSDQVNVVIFQHRLHELTGTADVYMNDSRGQMFGVRYVQLDDELFEALGSWMPTTKTVDGQTVSL